MSWLEFDKAHYEHENLQCSMLENDYLHFESFLVWCRHYKVFRAECNATGQQVDIKRFHKRSLSAKEAVHVAREVHLMGILRGEHNIIHILGFFEDENYAYIVMEYCAGRDLYQTVVAEQRLDEPFAAATVITPLLTTLHRLHSIHNIIHRDIKPENVLLSASGEVRLADFGTAIQCEVEVPFLAVGTLDFMAPEVLGSLAPKGAVESPCTTPEMLEEAGLKPYDFKADVWSLGALAYELVVGEPPFYHEEPEQTKELILGSAYLYIPRKFKDTPFARFVAAAMTKDPAARPTAEELLKHEWIAQHAQHAEQNARKNTFPNSPFLQIHVDTTGNVPLIQNNDTEAAAPYGSGSFDEDSPRAVAAQNKNNNNPFSNNSLSRTASYSTMDTSLYNDFSGLSGTSTTAGVRNSLPVQRLKSALMPQGSWLRKFTIRRNNNNNVEAVSSSENYMSDDMNE